LNISFRPAKKADEESALKMTPSQAKHPIPVERVRRYLEPGPIVLVSSKWHGKTNIMTMGWHLLMEFSPSLVGCVIAAGNHSFEMIRKSRECVINVPTTELTDIVVKAGNTSGADVDKFGAFGLTPMSAEGVDAPLIAQCYGNFACRLYDDTLVDKYNFFIFEVVSAQVAMTPDLPQTLHYTGDGVFTISGKTDSRRHLFRPEML
jgi:flavin reductase (DIM6/NTAB) family NADH-FMN oxidoreductase RutF